MGISVNGGSAGASLIRARLRVRLIEVDDRLPTKWPTLYVLTLSSSGGNVLGAPRTLLPRGDDVDRQAPRVTGSRLRPESVSEAHTSTAWVRIASARRAARSASRAAMAAASGACATRSDRSPASRASMTSGLLSMARTSQL